MAGGLSKTFTQRRSGSPPITVHGPAEPGARHPDWTQSDHYAALAQADRTVFAWEWTRRSRAYRQAWNEHRSCPVPWAPDPREFGLERFEDPALGMPHARPVWTASVDPAVIRARVQGFEAPAEDRIDLLQWPELVTVAIDDHQVEHLLLSNGELVLRIDILEGTLIGCPAALGYFLEGLQALEGPLSALEQLRVLRRTGHLCRRSLRAAQMQHRWILELRVADAIVAGADQQQIARTLFGPAIAPERWRVADPAYRRRVQRLVHTARRRLEAPLDPRWFGRSR